MNILISGGTSGVGKAVAKSFAFEDNNITLLGRNEDRSKQAVNDLKDLTGNQNIDYLLGDLAVESENKKVYDRFEIGYIFDFGLGCYVICYFTLDQNV
ncbi:SDR family NAD(P)-dependent oxidoreductase [Pediococcus argentinicus]|uniref:SDR family NAD(P)-dependent oxidoreductase n=1 Tax=Pediococcus argentinicus TaxID=480391 RepID=UPI00338EABEA